MSEAETIDIHILPVLKAAGWGAEGSRIRREYPIASSGIVGLGRHSKPEQITKVFAGF